MTLNIQVSQKAEVALRQRAAAAGQPIDKYVSDLVEQVASRPSLEELLAPVQEDFARSGLTESDLLDLGQDLLEKVRDDKTRQ